MLMPFGKHKGKDMNDLPIKYVKWLAENADLYGELQAAVYQRLGLAIPQRKSMYERLDEVVNETHERLFEDI
jgi:uncharacterized protein (DUF3820 family)